MWKNTTIPECWKRADGCFVPKEENASQVSQFRTISLLSVEYKIFFAVISKRLTAYMIGNKYLDTSVQKGGIPGMSGCIEHVAVLTKQIKDVKKPRKN